MDRFQAMQHFVRVVDAGSFSAAARQLHLGQPALSKSVAMLEAALGVRLLVRTTRALALTDAGQRFLAHARAALDEADAADAAARNQAAALAGRLRVAAPPVYAAHMIVPRLGDFLAHHPGLALDLLLDDHPVDLVAEGVDCAIRAGALAGPATIGRRIDTAPRLLVATPAFLQRHGTPTRPADCRGLPFVGYGGFRHEWPWRLCGPNGATATVDADVRLEVSAAEGLRAALLAGLGMGVISARMCPNELAGGLLVPLLPGWTLPPTPIWLLYPEGRRPSARARAFAEWLGAVLARSPSSGTSP